MANESESMGISPDQLTAITSSWRRDADAIEALVWSAIAGATGAGSDVLAAVRACADPAKQAMTSIADRFDTMAGLVDKYSANVEAEDGEIAREFDTLSAR
jgi:hypothetical protein